MLAILTTKTRKSLFRSSHPEVILRKGVPKKCSKFTGEHPKLQSNFIEIALPHECSPVNLLHIFRTHFPKASLPLHLYISFLY